MTKREYNNLVFRHDTNARYIQEHRQENKFLEIAILASDFNDIMVDYQVKKYKHNQECIKMLADINKDLMAKIDDYHYNN